MATAAACPLATLHGLAFRVVLIGGVTFGHAVFGPAVLSARLWGRYARGPASVGVAELAGAVVYQDRPVADHAARSPAEVHRRNARPRLPASADPHGAPGGGVILRRLDFSAKRASLGDLRADLREFEWIWIPEPLFDRNSADVLGIAQSLRFPDGGDARTPPKEHQCTSVGA